MSCQLQQQATPSSAAVLLNSVPNATYISPLAADTSGNLYFHESLDNNVMILNGTTKSLSTLAWKGGGDLKALPDGNVLVLNRTSIYKYNIASKQTSLWITCPLLVNPMCFDFDYTNQCLYVADYGVFSATQSNFFVAQIPYSNPSAAKIVLKTSSIRIPQSIACLGNGQFCVVDQNSTIIVIGNNNGFSTILATMPINNGTYNALQFDLTHNILYFIAGKNICQISNPSQGLVSSPFTPMTTFATRYSTFDTPLIQTQQLTGLAVY
jgi:hypothetical protein